VISGLALPPDRLAEGVRAILKAHGAHGEVAADVARALVDTSRHGIDSHGVALLPRILDRVKNGRCQIESPVRSLEGYEDKAVAILDAGLAPGQHAGLAGARLAIERARRFGVGYAAIRNSTHFGACTPYVLHIVKAGMVALVGSNSTMSMAAFESPFVNLGNNPLGFGAPCAGADPVVFDFSCGIMSFGRLKALRAEGKDAPAGAFVRPVTRPGSDPVYEVAGTLTEAATPFGGYKGASIAFMVDVLAGVLGGGYFGARTETMEGSRFLGPSHFITAWDPGVTLGSAEALGERMHELAADVTGGDAGVRLPGKRSGECRRTRQRTGIPVDRALLDELRQLCSHAGVPADFLDQNVGA